MTMKTRRILDASEPEKIFSKDNIEKEYKAMAKRYHPDNYATGSHVLFTKINELHVIGLRKIQDGTWDTHELIMTTPSGATFKFRYETKEKTEYGQRFISSQHIALSTRLNDFSDRFKHSVSHCQAYVKTSVKMHENFHQLIPVLKTEANVFTSYLHGDVIMMARPTPAFHSVQAVLDANEVIPHKQVT